MTALGLNTIAYAPGITKGQRAPEDWGRAATLNRVLRRLYPDSAYGEGKTVASALSPVCIDDLHCELSRGTQNPHDSTAYFGKHDTGMVCSDHA